MISVLWHRSNGISMSREGSRIAESLRRQRQCVDTLGKHSGVSTFSGSKRQTPSNQRRKVFRVALTGRSEIYIEALNTNEKYTMSSRIG